MQRFQSPNVVSVVFLLFAAAPAFANDDVIRFDMPPTVAATPIDADANLVQCELNLSSLIESPSVPRIDQWLVRCQPRGTAMSITDYAPRTESRSEIDGPIQIKISDEETSSLGLNVSGDYGSVVHGSVGADNGSKNCLTQQYNRIAPVQTVIASGTIDRGRGVYFKLRWTATQTLEGEKVFKLSMNVPDTWRGGLIDVSVLAQSAHRTFGGLDTQIKTLGAANFVVTAYRSGDQQAADIAHQLTVAELKLRQLSRDANLGSKPTTLPSMLRHVAAKLDLDSEPPSIAWLSRLTSGQADPYLDRDINRLPMNVRVAAIEYHDQRIKFTQLVSDAS
ncbi:MAG: hypothetical protein WBD20_22085 [Pirellulaceae bacterium]